MMSSKTSRLGNMKYFRIGITLFLPTCKTAKLFLPLPLSIVPPKKSWNFLSQIRLWYLGAGLLIKRYERSRELGMKCASELRYPISLFHSKYGDRYPIVLTKIKEKNPNLRGKTVGRSGPKATAERFRSFSIYLKFKRLCDKVERSKNY